MRIRSIAVLFVAVVSILGCSGESEKQVGDRLDEKGARDVLKEASEDEYTPPADGRLTRDQIEMYLEVRQREQEIAKVARERIEEGTEKIKGKEKSLSGLLEGVKSLGSAADFFTADIRAAQELGYNTAEYEWVKERILEAATSVMKERVASSSRAMLDRKADELRRKMEETDNDTERNTYARLLETYENNIAEEDDQIDPSVAYNRELLAEYEDALETIGLAFAKWETREGQAVEKVRQLDRDLQALEEGTKDPE